MTQPRSSHKRSSGERRSRKTNPQTEPAVREIRVSYRQLVASDLNYRTTFDREQLDELKQDLQHGLIHNLVVRPLPQDRFEVVVGGRRMRAIGELVEEGKWDPYALEIPIQVRADLDDADAIVIAMGENRKRQDVHYLEEAEGVHHALDLMTDGKGPTRKNKARTRLAEKLGVSPRWVQILDGLATRLHPDVKTFIRDQDLPLDAAKAFAIVPPEVQSLRLPDIARSRCDPHSIRDILTRGLPSTDNALFDRAHYKGETTQVELYVGAPDREAPANGEGVIEHFLDLSQFARLQRDALEQRRCALEKDYAFADVIEGRSLPAAYVEQYGIRDAETGIVLLVDPRDWFVHEVEVKKQNSDTDEPVSPESEATPPPPGHGAEIQPLAEVPGPCEPTSNPPLKKDHLYRAHRAKTAALQTQVAQSPIHAMRLVIAALLTSSTPLRIAPVEVRVSQDWALAPELEGDLRSVFETFGELFSMSSPDDRLSSFSPNVLSTPAWDEETPAQAFTILSKLPDSDVERFFALLVALRTGSFCDLNPKYGDTLSVVALAQMLGLERAEANLDEEFLSGYSKKHLVAVARACGIEDPKIEKRTMTEIRANILSNPGLAAFEPPELRFDSTTKVQKALEDLGSA